MKVCPVCGKVHDYPDPIGLPGSWLDGIEIKVCREIPEDCIYEVREYPTGPSGALHLIRRES